MKSRIFWVGVIVSVLIIIGISLIIYAGIEMGKYQDIWFNSDDPEASDAAFWKMGDYGGILALGIVLTVFSTFGLLVVLSQKTLIKDRDKKKVMVPLGKTVESEKSAGSSMYSIVSEVNQLICPFCGTIIHLKEKKETLKGKTIRCNDCDSEIVL
ncbi:MAG: hypothetical protein JW891_00870 [Candidatus Lokiarchaeota archaeon]|nr:hypothetical protein [Candidatus Lokiarchaeota archaeon]